MNRNAQECFQMNIYPLHQSPHYKSCEVALLLRTEVPDAPVAKARGSGRQINAMRRDRAAVSEAKAVSELDY